MWQTPQKLSQIDSSHHAITEQVGLVHEVCGQHHHPSLPILADQVPREAPAVRVHSRCRLVQEDHLAATDESDAHRQLPLLPAGQGLGFFVFFLRQTDVQQSFLAMDNGGGVGGVFRAAL